MYRALILFAALLLAAAQAPAPVGGDMSNTTVKATGGTTAIKQADRAAERINVRDYGAVCDNVADDRNAFAAVINRVNTLHASGIQSEIYVPTGICRIKGTNGVLPGFADGVNGAVVGDSPFRSWIAMDVSYVGGLFSWTEAWMDGTWNLPNTLVIGTNRAGPLVRDLTVVGDRNAAGPQLALNFADRVDYALVENVSMFYLNGGCIRAGAIKNQPAASGIRESSFINVRCMWSGATGQPSIQFTAEGVAGGNPITIRGMDIYASQGPGLVIKGAGTYTVNTYKISRLRIEGQEGNPNNVQGDLMQIGDPNYSTGLPIGNISMSQIDLLSVPAGFCALRVSGYDNATRPVGVTVTDGRIGTGGGTGKGLCIEALRTGYFQFTQLTSVDTNVTLGPLAAPNITLDLNGQGPDQVSPAVPGITYSVDAAAQRVAQSPVYMLGDLASGKASFAVTPHNGTIAGGNTPGVGSVDLQTSRSGAGQIAFGAFSTIGGGSGNSALAAEATISGGFSNNAAGVGSAIPGGLSAGDRGRTGWFGYANGDFATQGDAQFGWTPFRGSGSGAAAFRLTSNGTPATISAGTSNCLMLDDNRAYALAVHLHARNFTTPGQDFDWFVPNAMMIRDTGVATTVLTLGIPVTLTRGTVTGAAVVATADTTLGCLSLTFAPPTANTTDVWHAVARIDSVEAQ